MISKDSPDILKEIVKEKEIRVSQRKIALPIANLRSKVDRTSIPFNFAGRLMGNSIRVIAEVKKASPSKGIFRDELDVCELSSTYVQNGAAAISVLTNEDHFMGSIEDLAEVSETVHPNGVPVLRKEFIFDEYQIYEARAFGADAILLIVSMLSESQIGEFMDIANSLYLQCLVEIHDEDELEIAVNCGAEVIGINNRNLHSFKTSISVTENLAPKIPGNAIIVSESGIATKNDAERVFRAGAAAILVGESLVTAPDAGQALRSLL